MAARVEVLRCVTVRRVIAATDMPAAQAQPQMHPLRTDLETVLATFGRTRRYRMNLRQMFATHDPSHCISKSSWSILRADERNTVCRNAADH